MSIKVHFRLVIMWSFDIFIIIQEENQFPLFDDIEGHQGCINRGYLCKVRLKVQKVNNPPFFL